MWRSWLLLLIIAGAILALMLHGPILQDETYHEFADYRTVFGIPNMWNVLSNLPFFIAGILGLIEMTRCGSVINQKSLRLNYYIFFIGVALVAFGSAYYHLKPNNNTLVWDRLPMTISFAAFFAIILGEHINRSLARNAIIPLLALGAISIFWWQQTGDLRLYVLVQFLPMILTPIIIVLYPSSVPGAKIVWVVLIAYAGAKVFEHYDVQVYNLLGLSGHTIKHIVAAIGIYIFSRVVRVRQMC